VREAIDLAVLTPDNFLITKIRQKAIIVFICHCENMIHLV